MTRTHYRMILSLTLAAACAAALAAGAAEFRTRNPIATPAALPDGARPVGKPIPVDRRAVEQAVTKLFDAYAVDTTSAEKMLSPDFLDRSNLLATMNQRLPTDAKLRPLGIRSVQTLNQYFVTGPDGGETLVSTVTATVQGQLEFNDPAQGFQRMQGTSEYLFRVRQKIE